MRRYGAPKTSGDGRGRTWPALALILLVATAAEADETVDFNLDIKPLLSDRCFLCHGPDGGSRQSGFRLDQRDSAVGEADSGEHPLVPGKPDESELLRRISLDDDDYELMPPEEAHKPRLTPSEIDKIRRWIAAGAEHNEHWAYVPPTRPDVPTDDTGWASGPIDRFAIAAMKLHGLSPSKPADRIQLIRRVTMDLTGLPPTVDEVDAFLKDDSADAYEHVVDRLFRSPRYGENMARFWLDAVRYGDTHGLHLDNYREIWPYRDWVIGAFNDDMDWRTFTTKQIAGDLLPDPTKDDLIASGYNRLHVTTNEGGSIKEEVYVRNVVDRISTTGTVFLGLSVGCAQCHDHKFDPISAKDFYSLFAFFNSLDADPMDGNVKDYPPSIPVPTEQQQEQLTALESKLAGLESDAKQKLVDIVYAEPELTAHERNEFVWIDDELPSGADVSSSEESHSPWTFVAKTDHAPLSGGFSWMRRSEGLDQDFFTDATQGLRLGAGDKLFAYVYLDPDDPPEELMLQWYTGGWNHRAYWGANKIQWGNEGTSTRLRIGDLPETGKWARLDVDAGKVGIGSGSIVSGWAFTQFGGTVHWDKAGIVTGMPQEPVDYDWIDDDVPTGAQLQGEQPQWQWVTAADGHPVFKGQRSLRRSRDGLNQDVLTQAKPLILTSGDKLYAHVYLDPDNPPQSVQLQFYSNGWEHRARWGGPAHGSGGGGAADFIASETIPETGQWVRLEVPISEVGLKPGDAIDGWAFTQVDGTVYWDAAGIKTLNPPDDRDQYSLAVFIERAKSDATLPAKIREAAIGGTEGRSEAQETILKEYFVQWIWAATRSQFDAINVELTQTRDSLSVLRGAMPTTLVMKEKKLPEPAFLLKRGEYDQPDKDLGPVPRAVPSFLPPMPVSAPLDRLGFAQWLCAPEQPLMARVTVNRFWQQFFGVGIVSTADDFGSQGASPTHPKLLDWLASEFRDKDWSVKSIVKQMVMSNLYRQDSTITPAALKADPANTWLARGPRFRLDAEMLRDQALSVSGLLANQIGGPPVKPPQPDGLWEAVGYVGSNTAKFSADTEPEKVHRRSLYTFWKRTSPPPEMAVFDAPSREECVVSRERTNNPLQALLLLNDLQYFEAARHLAQSTIQEAGDETSPQIVERMFRKVTLREPRADEREVLTEVYREQLSVFEKDTEAARSLVTVGPLPVPQDAKIDELAAWTVVGNVLLNLDEIITRP